MAEAALQMDESLPDAPAASAEDGVPAGYKRTELGVIPADWETKKVGDMIDFSGGSQPPRTTFVFAPQKDYLRLIQIRDYKTDDFLTFIPAALANKICDEQDVMIGRYGPPIFQILRGIAGAYNVALIKAIAKKGLDRNFMYYFLKQEKLFTFIEALSQRSSGQTGVELPALKSYPFPLPPLPEQQAIAQALSDVDGWIGSLDALIAKKRDLKNRRHARTAHRPHPSARLLWRLGGKAAG